MGRPSLKIDVTPKDQKELDKLLSGGVQQVRVILRALVLRQLGKGASAPRISEVVPLTSQAIRTIARRYQKGGLESALFENLNTAVRFAAIERISPVRGLRACRDLVSRILNTR